MTKNERFERLCSRYVSSIENNLRKRLNKAKDKEYVLEEIKKETDFINKTLVSNPNIKELVDIFLDLYKKGENIDYIFRRISDRFDNEIEGIKPGTPVYKDGELIGTYPLEDEKELKQLTGDEKKLTKFLVSCIAYDEVEKGLPNLLTKTQQPEPVAKMDYTIQWTGRRDNKNEFVQLIYALHQAGYLNKGQGEITKVVESLAEILQLELGKNWQSNLSASIHKSNWDYEPPIFKKIAKAYQDYAEKLIENKKFK
ncbi:MAG: RteC domain-containing protein [Bacteroidetes bacterium]|nr:RteC domain-containing protein [Bacteroidota bacterium]